MSHLFTFALLLLAPFSHSDSQWTTIPNPGAKGGQAVFLTSHPSGMAMSWIDASAKFEGELKFAVFNGKSWQPTITVAEGKNLFINWADIPKLIFSENISVAVWPQMLSDGTYDYGLRYALSLDQGLSWQPAQWLHDDLQPREHGFVSLVLIDPDTIGAIWLDGRAMGQGHDHSQGSMQLRFREIRATGISQEVLLDEMTCECCGTDLVKFQNQLVAIYRNRTQEHLRDIEVAIRNHAGEWSKSNALPADRWTIQGCPVNGPALAQSEEHLTATWFTMADQSPRVRIAITGKELGTWTPLASVGTSPLGRVHSAFLDPNHLLVVWLETASPLNQFFYAVFDIRQPKQPILPATRLDATGKGRTSGFPKIFILEELTFIAYQDPEKPGVKLQKIPNTSLMLKN